jgi:hypothetical protein
MLQLETTLIGKNSLHLYLRSVEWDRQMILAALLHSFAPKMQNGLTGKG